MIIKRAATVFRLQLLFYRFYSDFVYPLLFKDSSLAFKEILPLPSPPAISSRPLDVSSFTASPVVSTSILNVMVLKQNLFQVCSAFSAMAVL